MAADVQEGVDLSAAVAHHQHRVLAHVGGEVIAGIGNLAVVAQEQPAAGEDTLQFLLVDVGFDENAAAYQAPLRVNQALHFGNHDLPLCFSTNEH